MSEMTPDDLPPENTDVAEPEPSLDDLVRTLDPIPVGTPAEIQTMLEAPTGVHHLSTGVDTTETIETAPLTQPGVDPAWQEPAVLQEDRQVLLVESGSQTVGER